VSGRRVLLEEQTAR